MAANGGICAYRFDTNGHVVVEPLELSTATLRALRDHLLLFFTGEARGASTRLSEQDSRTQAGDA